MGDFHRLRPFKLLALLLSTVSVVMTIISLAGPDWVSVQSYTGEFKSWGLWWDCWKAKGSFQICINADWLAACAALVFMALISALMATGVGAWGMKAKQRRPYVIAGLLCGLSSILQIITLVIYPVKFTSEVRDNTSTRQETASFHFDWTYGVAWGAVIFLIGSAISFFLRLRDEEGAQLMKASADKPTIYYAP